MRVINKMWNVTSSIYPNGLEYIAVRPPPNSKIIQNGIQNYQKLRKLFKTYFKLSNILYPLSNICGEKSNLYKNRHKNSQFLNLIILSKLFHPDSDIRFIRQLIFLKSNLCIRLKFNTFSAKLCLDTTRLSN